MFNPQKSHFLIPAFLDLAIACLTAMASLFARHAFRRCLQTTPSVDTASSAAALLKEHQIKTAIVLQRNPFQMLPLTPFECEYESYQQALQYEFSRGPFDNKSSSSAPSSGGATRKAAVEERAEEKTNNDSDSRNILRMPSRMLYLLVKSRATGIERWQFPDAFYSDTQSRVIEVCQHSLLTVERQRNGEEIARLWT